MSSPATSDYIICTRRKGQQKKHVAVCNACRLQLSCEAYQEYRQKNTNRNQEALLTIQAKPSKKYDLLNYVQGELREIILILRDYPTSKHSVGIAEIKDPPEGENLLLVVRKELGRLRTLF